MWESKPTTHSSAGLVKSYCELTEFLPSEQLPRVLHQAVVYKVPIINKIADADSKPVVDSLVYTLGMFADV